MEKRITKKQLIIALTVELSYQQERKNDEHFKFCIISHSISVINININTSCLSLSSEKRKVGESMEIGIDNYSMFEANEARLEALAREEERECRSWYVVEPYQDEDFLSDEESEQ